MIQEPVYNILFIDDDCKAYLPVLEPVAWTKGFNLYEALNVAEGLSLLSDNPDSIDAVLLDITFNPDEIQGLEALKKIKKLYPFLPVVMLTGSDRATDLHKVVECMRNGAYDYIGKQQLDPEHLLEILFEAIQKSKQQHRLETKTELNKTTDFYYIVQELDHNSNRYHAQAAFGFRLASVNKSKDSKEEDELKLSAQHWHHNVLKSLHIAYKDNLVVNLKYIAARGKIDCYIVFTLYEKDIFQLKSTLSNLFQDLRSFFSSKHSDSLQPYLFEEITDDTFLINVNQLNPKLVYTLFYRRPVKIKEYGTIGYSNPDLKGSASTQHQHRQKLLPFPVSAHFDNELLKAMLNQDGYAEIDIQLKLKNLSIEETQALKQVVDKPNLIASEKNKNEDKFYSDYLEQFVSSGENKYMVSIILKQENNYLDQHLKTGILNYFFGASLEVEISIRNYTQLFRYSNEVGYFDNQLPFTYSQSNVFQAFHFPIPEKKDIPGIRQQSQTFHQIPENIPTIGMLLGEKKISNKSIPIKINHENLTRHLYIMGQTGTGKSTMLKTMMFDCLKHNLPFALIDPHGDLYDDMIKLIPADLKNKLILIDTVHPEKSAKHNPIGIDATNPKSKSLVINELKRIFSTLYDMRNAGGPMFDLYLQNGMLLVLDEGVTNKFGSATLLTFVDVFLNDDFREMALEVCSNKKVINFFKVAERNSGDWSFNNFATYVTSKLTRFTEDFYLTPIITARDGNIDFRKLIDEGNILLVKLDKGLIGADNVSLLGQMIVSSIVTASKSRGNIEERQGKKYYLFIDEFQNFIKGDIDSALSEVRKYGLSMILANQTLGQLKDREDNVLEGLLGNVGSLVFFRPGINDYEKIRHYFEPDFDRTDVLKLPNFNCIGRIMIDNVPSDPFVFQTIQNII